MSERCILRTAGQGRRIYGIRSTDLNRALRIAFHTSEHVDMAHGQIDGLRREFPAQQIHQPADPGTVGKTKLIFSRIPGEELA
ncbi:hypothetical protein D3C71_2038700 [compost metagenome]